MIYSIAEPTFYISSESTWNCPKTRDEFIEHLISIIDYIDNHANTLIYWTNDYDDSIWTSPSPPPWRTNKDWSNALIPIILNKFQSKLKYIDIIPDNNLDLICDGLNLTDINSIKNAFMQSCHYVITNNENVFLILDCNKGKDKNIEYKFSCSCHDNYITPNQIYDANDFTEYNLHDVSYLYNLSIEEFQEKVIEFIEYFIKYSCRQILYKYSFSAKFIKSLKNERKYLIKAIRSISDRLTMNTKEAEFSKSLQDEQVINERRFRTSKAARIHYVFTADSKIEFIQYYPGSKHDDGL